DERSGRECSCSAKKLKDKETVPQESRTDGTAEWHQFNPQLIHNHEDGSGSSSRRRQCSSFWTCSNRCERRKGLGRYSSAPSSCTLLRSSSLSTPDNTMI